MIKICDPDTQHDYVPSKHFVTDVQWFFFLHISGLGWNSGTPAWNKPTHVVTVDLYRNLWTDLFLSLEFLKEDSKRKKTNSFSLPFDRISQDPGCTDVCPIKRLIKGFKWDCLELIAYAWLVMVNLLGPQGSDSPCLCKALIATRHQQHWACSPPFSHPMPQEYISIFCLKRAVASNLTAPV